SESVAAKFVRSQTGEAVSDALTWGASVGLLPAERMRLNADYAGGYLRDEDVTSTRHQIGTTFTHAPDPALNYRAAATLSNGQADAPQGVWQHEYRAGATLTVERRLRAYVFDLAEVVTAETGGSDDLLSAATVSTTLPLFTGVGLRHATTWEWITRVEPDGPPGSQYRHSTGVSIAHETIPFAFDTEYAFSHGYRGQRHDVASQLFVPLGRGFGFAGAFAFSAYEDDSTDVDPATTTRSPASFTLELVYEF
ncbi:MAG TPA: hypothetical protein VKA06_09170, partial [Spirochaetia bacterium]|nr:hypothetical protein [Spirochaetia bacterium]